mmetsp:Transcript_32310/g.90466  ORF Transcript_32310/g.90466 Transcript_32310/m.90466 type:complete len:648 (+) Transcript_32310:1-1944(+)
MTGRLRAWTLGTWAVFPIIEVLRMGSVVGPLWTEAMFAVADVLAKFAYSYVLTTGHFYLLREVSESRRILEEDTLTDPAKATTSMNSTLELFSLINEETAAGRHRNSARVRSISHELRTPLNAVIGYNECLLDGVHGQQKELVEGALNSARGLLDVIDQVVLQSSLAQDGGSPVASARSSPGFVECNFVEVAEEITQILTPRAVECSCDLVLDVTPDLEDVVFEGNLSLLYRVFLYLVDNAVRSVRGGTTRACVVGTFRMGEGGAAEWGDRRVVEFLVPCTVNLQDARGMGEGGDPPVAAVLASCQDRIAQLGGNVHCLHDAGEGGLSVVRVSVPLRLLVNEASVAHYVRPTVRQQFVENARIILLVRNRDFLDFLYRHLQRIGMNNVVPIGADTVGWTSQLGAAAREVMGLRNVCLFFLVDYPILERNLFDAAVQLLLSFPDLHVHVMHQSVDRVSQDVVEVIGEGRFGGATRTPLWISAVWELAKSFTLSERSWRSRASLHDQPNSGHSSGGGTALSVLVVDDNSMNLKVAGLMLQRADAIYATASNGMVAIDLLLQGEHYDLILMDVNMPVLDGIATTMKIRKLEKAGKLRGCRYIAFTTAAGDRETKKQCLESGANEFIKKPLTRKTIRFLLRKAKLRRSDSV